MIRKPQRVVICLNNSHSHISLDLFHCGVCVDKAEYADSHGDIASLHR